MALPGTSYCPAGQTSVDQGEHEVALVVVLNWPEGQLEQVRSAVAVPGTSYWPAEQTAVDHGEQEAALVVVLNVPVGQLEQAPDAKNWPAGQLSESWSGVPQAARRTSPETRLPQ